MRVSIGRLLVAAVCGVSLACADDAPTAADSGIDPSLLTPEVAAQLDARGMFPLQEPEAGYLNPRSRRDADSLARRAIASQAAEFLFAWQIQRGAPIQVGALRRCGPILYASSAYEVAAMTTSHTLRTEIVGRYEMLFCGADGRPALHVSVPIEAPITPIGGFVDVTHVLINGIPLEGESVELPSPEEAARIAAGRTGRRVAAVPERVRSRFRWTPTRYLVRLESSVAVYGIFSAVTDTIDFVMVGPFMSDEGLEIPLAALRPAQPATPTSRVDTIPPVLGDCPLCLYTARLGMPRWAEPFFPVVP